VSGRVFFNAQYRQAGESKGGVSGRSWGKGATRYAFTRENELGERLEREGFDADGSRARGSVYAMLDEAGDKDKVYTLVLNPGEGRGDLSEDARREWVRGTMERLEERLEARGHELKDWAAVSHVEQGGHDHVHVVGVTSHCLRKEDMPAMQEAARECLEEARELVPELEEDRLERVVEQVELDLEAEREREHQRGLDWDDY
jgi:DNA-binding protein YbaB